MSLLTTSAVRNRAEQANVFALESANILTERLKAQANVNSFDIFLSHAFDDQKIIAGVALTLED